VRSADVAALRGARAVDGPADRAPPSAGGAAVVGHRRPRGGTEPVGPPAPPRLPRAVGGTRRAARRSQPVGVYRRRRRRRPARRPRLLPPSAVPSVGHVPVSPACVVHGTLQPTACRGAAGRTQPGRGRIRRPAGVRDAPSDGTGRGPPPPRTTGGGRGTPALSPPPSVPASGGPGATPPRASGSGCSAPR
jgi:hypothetical protein